MSVHKNLLRTWLEHEVVDGNYKTVLVGETDLETRPDHEDFDSSEFDDLVNALITAMNKSNVIDSIRVVPVRSA